jgi:hypothetical protein
MESRVPVCGIMFGRLACIPDHTHGKRVRPAAHPRHPQGTPSAGCSPPSSASPRTESPKTCGTRATSPTRTPATSTIINMDPARYPHLRRLTSFPWRSGRAGLSCPIMRGPCTWACVPAGGGPRHDHAVVGGEWEDGGVEVADGEEECLDLVAK